jgi:hypothetical protein
MEFGDERENDDRFRRALKKDPTFKPTTQQEFYAHPQFAGKASEPDYPVFRQGRTDEGNLNLVKNFVKFR